jgi:hypothetical protein
MQKAGAQPSDEPRSCAPALYFNHGILHWDIAAQGGQWFRALGQRYSKGTSLSWNDLIKTVSPIYCKNFAWDKGMMIFWGDRTISGQCA